MTLKRVIRYLSPVSNDDSSDPQVVVEHVSRSPAPELGHWNVTWKIQNLGQKQLEILACRLPHGRFLGQERKLSPGIKLAPGRSARLEFQVECCEKPGAVVENAFLVLRVRWLGEAWRIFARLRVTIDSEGAPEVVTELVTAQPIEFSDKK